MIQGWEESSIATKIAMGKAQDFEVTCIHSYIVGEPEIMDDTWKSSLMKDDSFLLQWGVTASYSTDPLIKLSHSKHFQLHIS